MIKKSPEEELELAISKYDFENMKEAVKNGAYPNDMILHRVINQDNLEMYLYFIKSPELKIHCNIDYEYSVFGRLHPSFNYACSCDAKKILNYMIENTDENKFDLEKITNFALVHAADGGSINAMNELLNNNKTKKYCNFDAVFNKIIKAAESRNRMTFIEYMAIIVPLDKLNEMIDILKKDELKKTVEKIKGMRFLNEKLNKEIIVYNDKNINKI